MSVYDILEEAGFEVYLVNANETKHLPRKSDVQESQWLMKLHTYGLLQNVPSTDSMPRPLPCASRDVQDLAWCLPPQIGE